MTEKAREKCPELVEQIEALVVVQFGRGQMAGHNDAYGKVMQRLEEIRTSLFEETKDESPGARKIENPT